MKKNSELFELIKSLNKNEKRYFRLYTSLQNGSKKYLILFNEIDKQKIYDENKIKESVKDEKLKKNFGFNKSYLRGLILRSLILYNASNIVDIEILNAISAAKILFRKALYGHYFKMLKTAKQLALKYERLGYLLEIMDMEKVIIKKEELHIKKSRALYKDAKNIIDKIDNRFEYSRIISQILHTYRGTGIKREEKNYKKIKNYIQKTFDSENKALSISAKESFYRIKQLFSEAEGNFNLVLYNLKKRLEITEKSPEVFKDLIIDQKIDVLADLINTSIKLGKLDEAEKYLEVISSISPANESDKIDVEVTSVFGMFEVLIKRKDYISAYNYIPKLENLMGKYKNKLLIETELSIKFYMVKTLILAGKFEDALTSINYLLVHPFINKREDYKFYLSILNLIIHYELKNFNLLNHLIRSARRMLLKEKRLYKTEQAILKFLNKLPDIENDADRIKHLENFRMTLLILKAEPYEKNAFEYFDFLEWVDTKI